LAVVPVLVHLVHGTWPFGLFGRFFINTKAWFEDGSLFRNNVARFADCSIEFREFRWSGKNSFSARWRASSQFSEYLERTCLENPTARHVIVAHSHGGTVAARTIGLKKHQSDPPIKAIICLSTPFAYLSLADTRDELLFSGALASVISLPILTYLVTASSVWWFLTAAFFIPILFSILIMGLGTSGPFGSYFPAVIDATIHNSRYARRGDAHDRLRSIPWSFSSRDI
jgi:hypothetical protein